MHDDRVHADLTHQHDIPGKFGHGVGVAHGIAAEFHHHDRARVALQVGQGFVQGAGGGDPVSVHRLLLHLGCILDAGKALDGRTSPNAGNCEEEIQERPAMIALKVGMPSPFSELVSTISG